MAKREHVVEIEHGNTATVQSLVSEHRRLLSRKSAAHMESKEWTLKAHTY
ncbi:hypothetical protein [Vibrio sp. vnigr-6D03]|nr:hypothetical protein [Vibrio sp. vnigr-6D03]